MTLFGKAALAFVTLSVLAATPSHAQDWPKQPIRIVVGFGAGGGTDIAARIVAQPLSEMLGQPVVVENRVGAGGSIGSAAVAKAPPDGYTLLVNSNAHSVNPAIYAKLPYDTLKDFVDIAPLAMQPNVLVVDAGSPYKTVIDLVKVARARPGALNWGHAGNGTGTHLNAEKFVAAAKIEVTQVPYKGTPEVIQAILGGSVDCFWAPISAAIPYIRGGRVRPLAVSTHMRTSLLPDVPTTAEAGVTGADAPLWIGLWAPAATPAKVVAKVSADTRRALADPAVREKLSGLGNEIMDMPPERFARFVRDEIHEYAEVIRAAGIRPQ
jgi:tripartite-type tricarboxylate transporter receptor subunit TctC